MSKSKTTPYPDDVTEELRQLGWLSDCSEALLSWFSKNGRWRDLPKGKSLFRDGDETDGMYGVSEGALDLKFAPEAALDVITFRLQPGSWVGHGSLVPGMPRPFSVRAAMDSQVYYVSSRDLRNMLQEQPEFWPEFYALTIYQILELMAFIGEAQSLPPEVRLARQLQKLSPVEGAIRLVQSDLAATLGMSKSSVRRALKKLTERRAIKTGYNRVEIVDEDILNNLCKSTPKL